LAKYIGKRLIYMVIMLIVVSIIGFIIIQLPPGDYLSSYIMILKASGQDVSDDIVQSLTNQFGLDLPLHRQYVKWISGIILRGDFGRSFKWNKPVRDMIGERMLLTLLVSVGTMIFTYTVSILTGIISARRQYSVSDYVMSVIAFVGMSVPGFLLALFLLYVVFKSTGRVMTGLFSPEFISAPWSLARVWDMAKHMPIPLFINGFAGMAGLFRVMRGCMLDELGKEYVVTARAKGVSEARLLLKYPARVAINPIISTMAWMFPQIISGGTIVAIVLSLPTVGTLLIESLKTQDMYLAATLVVFLAALTVVGTFVSDLMLALTDPRLKFE
jgi:peptide/nickel transport system permease protein